MPSGAEQIRAASGKLGTWLAGAFAVALAMAVVVQLDNFSAKKAAGALLFLAFLGAAIVSRRPKEIFLFGCIFACTYNRQFFLFEGLVGSHGMQGPHLIAADAFLFSLLALWLYETAVLKRPSRPLAPALWPWVLPYVVACLLSFFVAVRLVCRMSVRKLSQLEQLLPMAFRDTLGAPDCWKYRLN